MKYNQLFIYLFFLLFTSACKSTYSSVEDKLLYDGASINVTNLVNEQTNKKLKDQLSNDILQKANSTFLGKKWKLDIYEKNKNKPKGIGNWLYKKLGEAPVYYSFSKTKQSVQLIRQTLKNNGFLDALVRMDTIVKNNGVQVTYQIEGGDAYTIQDYILPPDTTALLSLFNQYLKESFIKEGKNYTLSSIDAERLRLENLARNNGYYEFDQSAIFFYIDTTNHVDRTLSIHLNLSPPVNKKNYQPYQLGNITIYPDYALDSDSMTNLSKDTIISKHWQLIQNKRIIRLDPLKEAIAQDSGAVYSVQLENQAINYLLDLDIFKFVNLKYSKDTINGQPILNRIFYLTPSENQDIGIELEASTQRTNFLGSSIGLRYAHRNIFRGAEAFNVVLSSGVETQAGNEGPFVNTLNFSLNTNLTIPRLLLPFKVTKRLPNAIPSTLINLTTSYQKRNELFTSVSFVGELAYSWKKNKRIQHQFSPVQFTLLQLLNTSEAFTEELLLNPRLRASFDDVVILALKYKFTYSNQLLNKRTNFFYCRGEIETSGNLASLIASGSADEQKLFNTPIAQYVRTTFEGRYTLYQSKTNLVFRLSGGLAIPYGLSSAVPYIRQFFVGGANSLRAFRFRGIGPGTYDPTANSTNENIVFFDRVGDIKLEANIEYRFPIFSYLKGALFLDSGNIWLTKKSAEDLPSGKFNLNSFHNQIALGTGFGLRLDIQYVILRFDIGIPIRNPSFSENNGWIISTLNGLDRQWINQNVKYNLAIGYPF